MSHSLRCVSAFLISAVAFLAAAPAFAQFRAGAVAVDITPTKFPVFVNGGFISRKATKVHSNLFARAIALDDGKTRIAIMVVDSCMMPRPLLDQAKAAASKSTGIPVEHMLISSTHTHSAPSTFSCLGTPSDPDYEKFVVPKLVEAIETAVKQLEPAQVGSAVINADPYTAIRRWVLRPDKVRTDPFGNRSVRATMHAASRSADAVGPTGPEDPDLSIVSVQAHDGRPIALLANFANHYVGAPALSADYFGLFADRIEKRIAPTVEDKQQARNFPPVVGMMSQGTSGDVWLWDYFSTEKRKRPDISKYTDGMVDLAFKAYKGIEYKSDVTLAMAQVDLPLRYRVPDGQRLTWAKKVVADMGDRLPKTQIEVYANEAIRLYEMQQTKIVLQAVRIGDIGLTALPNEVYALTGLKLKALSPLQPTINIELANGADGYIPPPEQHFLGGYNCWPARSAGLEVQAEPKIVEALAQLLEQVSQKPRRKIPVIRGGALAKAVLASKPAAYWPMNEWQAPRARDIASGFDGIYEQGVVYYLEGPRFGQASDKAGHQKINRCPHFAGGRMRASIKNLGSTYSVEMWFWNGMVTDARPVTGYLFSRGTDHAHDAPGDHIGMGGTHDKQMTGKLFFFNGNKKNQVLVGKTTIKRWTWNHLVMVRDGKKVAIYLNGEENPQIEGEADVTIRPDIDQIFIGGRNDRYASFEGRIDEVSVYRRALSAQEIKAHFQSVGGK